MQKENIVFIGGNGRMGQLLQDRLHNTDFNAISLDRPLGKKRLEQEIKNAVAVVLCTPVEAISEIMSLITPYLDDNKLLMDISSIKVMPMQTMQQHYQGPIIGTHPLFGPGAKRVCISSKNIETSTQLKVALTPADNCPTKWVEWSINFFRQMSFSPFITTPQIHDKAASAIQGLNFITSAAYFAMMANHPEYVDFLTPSFQRRLESSQKSLTEDGEIFCAMFNDNPSSQETVEEFQAYLAKATKDIKKILKQARWWWEN
ncbi:prephenate dehydrogenase/arogenate dehydrogenase family protein [Desulfovibrio litoralis]|uniref:Prephenate dehydrogenase n=1 Tax=Desulfovibrio litoralis DSM 11393 TaxID=1121455 RepID=A0A1M7RR90_9BACT|nr:prephenate dehydrogenase/arogenate dehydrogenase family protein [Desulfovibrio litoralis]SHN48847.1 prephenate dehydrogenase [Desulfovibrio litoralis DSM 11393]